MSKIRVLDEHLTNMIAAGEVVERPAGIIKELIENSIDAQSSSIEVRVKEGGMELIEVSDDGHGMGKEDLLQAFERHSTSKIHSKEDLNAIASFGFRGEALPSIASVTRVLASSHDGQEGHMIDIDNGRKLDFSRFARNKGTTISVKHLFLKTPARLKYIKSINYENSIILDIVQKFAIGNPHISFSLFSDDKLSFRSFGNGDITDVFARIHGSFIARDCIEFSNDNYDFEINGVMALPQHTRSNRYGIWVYINNRMIRLPKAQKAVLEAYRRHIPNGRYPIVMINIQVDAQLVDVNVHPSKWEVRLSKDDVLVELIIKTIEEALGHSMRPQRIKIKESIPQQADFKEFLANSVSDKVIEQVSKTITEEEPDYVPEYPLKETIEDKTILIEEELKQPILGEQEVESIEETKESYSIETLTVLSQMSGKYILAQGDLGLYIIDQHAAMERVRYEYFQKKLLDKKTPVQEFLIPLIIEGRRVSTDDLTKINTVFQDYQIELEVLDHDTLVVRSHPLWIKEKEVKEFVNQVLDLIENNRNIREETLRQDTLATLACHSSVRFNEYMSMDEMIALVEDLRRCEQGYHCPHGRPTFITVEHDQLIKEFKR